MEIPNKVSIEDSLRLENMRLKKLLVSLQTQLAEKEEALLFAHLRTNYKMAEGDEVNPETREIIRAAPPAPDAAAKPDDKAE